MDYPSTSASPLKTGRPPVTSSTASDFTLLRDYILLEGQCAPEHTHPKFSIFFRGTINVFSDELRDICNLISVLWKRYKEGIVTILFGGVKSILGLFYDRLVTASTSYVNTTKFINRLRVIALDCIDVCVDHACDIGWYVSLDSFAEGCSFDLPDGSCEQRVHTLARVLEYRMQQGKVYSISKSGKRRLWIPRSQFFRKMSECILQYTTEPPDVGWMSQPPNISNSWSWV